MFQNLPQIQLLLCVSSAFAADLDIFPAVDFLNHGYNSLHGSPMLSGSDSGWRTSSIFDVACSSCFAEARQFERFIVPDGVTINPSSQCSYEPKTSHITDSTSYQDESNKVISWSGTIKHIPIVHKVRFSATADFTKVDKLPSDPASNPPLLRRSTKGV